MYVFSLILLLYNQDDDKIDRKLIQALFVREIPLYLLRFFPKIYNSSKTTRFSGSNLEPHFLFTTTTTHKITYLNE